eukprot:g10542.t1
MTEYRASTLKDMAAALAPREGRRTKKLVEQEGPKAGSKSSYLIFAENYKRETKWECFKSRGPTDYYYVRRSGRRVGTGVSSSSRNFGDFDEDVKAYAAANKMKLKQVKVPGQLYFAFEYNHNTECMHVNNRDPDMIAEAKNLLEKSYAMRDKRPYVPKGRKKDGDEPSTSSASQPPPPPPKQGERAKRNKRESADGQMYALVGDGEGQLHVLVEEAGTVHDQFNDISPIGGNERSREVAARGTYPRMHKQVEPDGGSNSIHDMIREAHDERLRLAALRKEDGKFHMMSGGDGSNNPPRRFEDIDVDAPPTPEGPPGTGPPSPTDSYTWRGMRDDWARGRAGQNWQEFTGPERDEFKSMMANCGPDPSNYSAEEWFNWINKNQPRSDARGQRGPRGGGGHRRKMRDRGANGGSNASSDMGPSPPVTAGATSSNDEYIHVREEGIEQIPQQQASIHSGPTDFEASPDRRGDDAEEESVREESPDKPTDGAAGDLEAMLGEVIASSRGQEPSAAYMSAGVGSYEEQQAVEATDLAGSANWGSAYEEAGSVTFRGDVHEGDEQERVDGDNIIDPFQDMPDILNVCSTMHQAPLRPDRHLSGTDTDHQYEQPPYGPAGNGSGSNNVHRFEPTGAPFMTRAEVAQGAATPSNYAIGTPQQSEYSAQSQREDFPQASEISSLRGHGPPDIYWNGHPENKALMGHRSFTPFNNVVPGDQQSTMMQPVMNTAQSAQLNTPYGVNNVPLPTGGAVAFDTSFAGPVGLTLGEGPGMTNMPNFQIGGSSSSRAEAQAIGFQENLFDPLAATIANFQNIGLATPVANFQNLGLIPLPRSTANVVQPVAASALSQETVVPPANTTTAGSIRHNLVPPLPPLASGAVTGQLMNLPEPVPPVIGSTVTTPLQPEQLDSARVLLRQGSPRSPAEEHQFAKRTGIVASTRVEAVSPKTLAIQKSQEELMARRLVRTGPQATPASQTDEYDRRTRSTTAAMPTSAFYVQGNNTPTFPGAIEQTTRSRGPRASSSPAGSPGLGPVTTTAAQAGQPNDGFYKQRCQELEQQMRQQHQNIAAQQENIDRQRDQFHRKVDDADSRQEQALIPQREQMQEEHKRSMEQMQQQMEQRMQQFVRQQAEQQQRQMEKMQEKWNQQVQPQFTARTTTSAAPTQAATTTAPTVTGHPQPASSNTWRAPTATSAPAATPTSAPVVPDAIRPDLTWSDAQVQKAMRIAQQDGADKTRKRLEAEYQQQLEQAAAKEKEQRLKREKQLQEEADTRVQLEQAKHAAAMEEAKHTLEQLQKAQARRTERGSNDGGNNSYSRSATEPRSQAGHTYTSSYAAGDGGQGGRGRSEQGSGRTTGQRYSSTAAYRAPDTGMQSSFSFGGGQGASLFAAGSSSTAGMTTGHAYTHPTTATEAPQATGGAFNGGYTKAPFNQTRVDSAAAASAAHASGAPAGQGSRRGSQEDFGGAANPDRNDDNRRWNNNQWGGRRGGRGGRWQNRWDDRDDEDDGAGSDRTDDGVPIGRSEYAVALQEVRDEAFRRGYLRFGGAIPPETVHQCENHGYSGNYYTALSIPAVLGQPGYSLQNLPRRANVNELEHNCQILLRILKGSELPYVGNLEVLRLANLRWPNQRSQENSQKTIDQDNDFQACLKTTVGQLRKVTDHNELERVFATNMHRLIRGGREVCGGGDRNRIKFGLADLPQVVKCLMNRIEIQFPDLSTHGFDGTTDLQPWEQAVRKAYRQTLLVKDGHLDHMTWYGALIVEIQQQQDDGDPESVRTQRIMQESVEAYAGDVLTRCTLFLKMAGTDNKKILEAGMHHLIMALEQKVTLCRKAARVDMAELPVPAYFNGEGRLFLEAYGVRIEEVNKRLRKREKTLKPLEVAPRGDLHTLAVIEAIYYAQHDAKNLAILTNLSFVPIAAGAEQYMRDLAASVGYSNNGRILDIQADRQRTGGANGHNLQLHENKAGSGSGNPSKNTNSYGSGGGNGYYGYNNTTRNFKGNWRDDQGFNAMGEDATAPDPLLQDDVGTGIGDGGGDSMHLMAEDLGKMPVGKRANKGTYCSANGAIRPKYSKLLKAVNTTCDRAHNGECINNTVLTPIEGPKIEFQGPRTDFFCGLDLIDDCPWGRGCMLAHIRSGFATDQDRKRFVKVSLGVDDAEGRIICTEAENAFMSYTKDKKKKFYNYFEGKTMQEIRTTLAYTATDKFPFDKSEGNAPLYHNMQVTMPYNWADQSELTKKFTGAATRPGLLQQLQDANISITSSF